MVLQGVITTECRSPVSSFGAGPCVILAARYRCARDEKYYVTLSHVDATGVDRLMVNFLASIQHGRGPEPVDLYIATSDSVLGESDVLPRVLCKLCALFPQNLRIVHYTPTAGMLSVDPLDGRADSFVALSGKEQRKAKSQLALLCG